MYKERKSIRLQNYDYSSEGIYYVTICTKAREEHFGKIFDSKISFSEIGLIARLYWSEIPTHFKHVILDDFIVMPNHLHGILILDYSLVGTRRGVSLHSHQDDPVGPCHGMASQKTIHNYGQNLNQFSGPVKDSLSVIISQYKSSVKRWCNNNGHDYFNWQPRFYDHIVNTEDSLDLIREYINNNVKNWKSDDLFIE